MYPPLLWHQSFPPKCATLEVVPRLVLWLCGCEVVFQKRLNVLKCGPFVGVLLPALPHHLVERVWAALGTRHAVASLDLLKNLAIHHACRTHRGIECE